MSHLTQNSGLQQAPAVWQDSTTVATTTAPSNVISVQNHNFINDIFDKGPPQANNQQQPQYTNHIHHLPQTRGAKAHRYMTRQSHPININLNNNNNNSRLPPNVVFRALPFYDKVCELITPTGLTSDGIIGRPNESHIEFRLTIDQADLIASTRDTVHIILRFCYFDTSSEQDDNFPPDISIMVNDCQVALPAAISNPNRPNVPAKRPGQYVDITKLCKLCPYENNFIKVKWFVDPTEPHRSYATNIIIGEKVSPENLLQRILDRGLSDPEGTKRLISDSDSEVATTNLQCSLMCPLGKMKMTNPCKSSKCHHIPCFDASVYLQMNEKKATWICPICYKPAYFPDLEIDGFFMDILQKTSPNVTEVTLNLDGSWDPVLKLELHPTSAKNPPPEIITISDDDD